MLFSLLKSAYASGLESSFLYYVAPFDFVSKDSCLERGFSGLWELSSPFRGESGDGSAITYFRFLATFLFFLCFFSDILRLELAFSPRSIDGCISGAFKAGLSLSFSRIDSGYFTVPGNTKSYLGCLLTTVGTGSGAGGVTEGVIDFFGAIVTVVVGVLFRGGWIKSIIFALLGPSFAERVGEFLGCYYTTGAMGASFTALEAPDPAPGIPPLNILCIFSHWFFCAAFKSAAACALVLAATSLLTALVALSLPDGEDYWFSTLLASFLSELLIIFAMLPPALDEELCCLLSVSSSDWFWSI